MRLTKLRIVGFKTFVEPTDIPIEPGLTGVVGPNGCGKSNLVEALRWVMGESSHKSLRATGMDEVIFGGSAKRPARNTADVTLAIDNSDRSAPAAFNGADTLEVSRRIERGQGSTYHVNSREARARDVQLLFADAATGARSPAMVRQGQISELIAAKPQARRRVLEDAAGIAGLHARRHEAELRLKQADDNLLRVDDVLRELDSQIESLRRQGRQAARYRGLSGEIRKLEAKLAAAGWLAAERERTAAETAARADIRAVADRALAQTEAARTQAVAAHEIGPLREQEVAAAAALRRLTQARSELEAEERRARERLAELARRTVELDADTERQAQARRDAETTTRRLATERDALVATLGADAARRTARAAALAEADAALAESEAALAAAQREMAELSARRAALGREHEAERERAGRGAREAERLGRERDALAASLVGLNAAALRSGLATAGEAAVEAERAALSAREDLGAIRDLEAGERAKAAEAERAAQRPETELATLRKLFSADRGRRFATLLDAITVEPGYERAVAAALGDDLDASTDPAAPLRWQEAGSGPDDPALPDRGREPRRVRRRPAGSHPTSAADRARRARGRACPRRPAQGRAAPGITRRRPVALGRPGRDGRGALLGRTPACGEEPHRGARPRGGGGARSCRRAPRRRGRSRKPHPRGRPARGCRRRGRRASAAGTRCVPRGACPGRAPRGRRARQALRPREAGRRVEAGAHEARGRADEAERRLRDIPDGTLGERRYAEARARAAEDRSRAAAAHSALAAALREQEIAAARQTAIDEDLLLWAERAERAEAASAELATRLAAAVAERADLDAAPDAFVLRRRTLAGEQAAAETRRSEAADRLRGAELALVETDRAARAALEELGRAREARAASEARSDALNRRVAELARAIRDSFSAEPGELVAQSGLKDSREVETAAVESRLAGLKVDRERLGGVNLRAEEELAEGEGKRNGLAAERDDLVEAIRRLRLAVSALNREGRERLQAAFGIVDGHFRRLFTTLFGGGEAELTLVDSDDPLEAGLEIVARPPGKRPQSLSLLSGGEQALTATALIFAVFLTNPSPVCVLDEVDAPLDDANVERFCDLLRAMVGETDTRFLVITHNPITMARMDRLFGVTMAERGISQLVAVDLEAAERLRDAG